VGEPWVPARLSGRLISLRARDLRDMTDAELEQALADRRQELFNLRFQSATGALENPARLKLAKREIARILTVRTEREHTLGTR
jgi:large subunit ribosomal protein L29